MRSFDHRDGEAFGQEIHRNPAAHRACADNADFGDGAQRDILGDAVNFGGFAFGKEDMALGRRLGAHHQLHKFGAFERHAFIKREPRCRLDTGEVGIGRIKAPPLARIGGFERIDRVRIGRNGQVTCRARAVGNIGAGKGNRVFGKAGFACQFIDKACFLGFGRRNRRAAACHFGGKRDPDKARQALGATCAGEQAELDFGHAQFGRRHRDAIMRAERGF